MRKIIGFILLCLSMLSCKKDESTTPLDITITPASLIFSAKSNTYITFQVQSTSKTGLKKFYITADPDYAPSTVILDSTLIGQKTFNISFDYLIPDHSSDYTTIVSFQIIDNDGNVETEARQINVLSNSIPLSEYSGISIYSKKSGKPDAYDLVDLTTLFSGSSPSSKRDIQIASDLDTSNTLSRSWVSPSGAGFVVYNSFDFNNATRSSLENAYDAGSKSTELTNLNENDIILVKASRVDSVIFSAIKILSIIDQDSTLSDRYIVDVKR